MFSGIIKEIGKIKNIQRQRDNLIISIFSKNAIGCLEVGSSISIDGICQTVIMKAKDNFSVQAVKETLKLTTLGAFKVGQNVNLEPALRLNDEISGHLISGHIDGIGKIIDLKKNSGSTLLKIAPPEKLNKYISLRGSIAIDGISLTIAKLNSNSFTVALISHTLASTTMSQKKIGNYVNIEVDMLAKYAEKKSTNKEKGKLNYKKLIELGF